MKIFRTVLWACVMVLCVLCLNQPVLSDEGDTAYPGYTGDPFTQDPLELITQEYFGNEWVNTIPSGVYNGGGQLIMSPYEHHGYMAGSPAQLTAYDGEMGTYAYFKMLAERSPRVKMWNIGKTFLGLDEYVVAISTEDTIARLDEYKENLQKLADPRKLGFPGDKEGADAAAQALIADRGKVKPVYWIWAKVHSSEVGSGEMVMELAYRLAVEERQPFKEIIENSIILITDPNPDGTEMTANWVNFWLNSGTGWQPGAPFYNWYTQHDNNRDTHVNSQPAQLNLVREYKNWPAQVVLDIHQSYFLLFTFSGMEPTFPSIDPITQTEWQWLASRELNQAEKFNMPGVWEYKYVNMYYAMYQIQMANFRSGSGRFYEVYGRSYPTTFTTSGPFYGGGGSLSEWMWYNPDPYKYLDIVWSFRNNINYSQTCVLTSAKDIARNAETILDNYWAKTKKAVSFPGGTAVGSTGKITYPYAYVVPAKQKDMPDTIRMINNLLYNGIEIHTADKSFKVDGKKYPKGSFIIRMDQPDSRCAYALLTGQPWPSGSPAPYDATGWEYDLMRDVEVDDIFNPNIWNKQMTLITDEQVALSGKVSKEAFNGAYVIDHESINNIVTLFFALAGDGYECYMADGKSGVIDPGDLLISVQQPGVYEALEAMVPELGLTMHTVGKGKFKNVAKHQLHAPRVAVYHCWRAIQDGGWSRFTFEQFKIPHDDITRVEVLAGNLKEKYDVIFLPDTSASNIYRGDTPGSVPEEVWYGPVRTTARTGGLQDEGMAALKQFVDDGGMLICNNASCDLPFNYGFIDGVTMLKARTSGNYFNAPGPIVKIEPSLAHPVSYGSDEYEYLYQNQSPVFTAPGDWVVAAYPADPTAIMMSGFLEGPEEVAGKAAIVDAPAKDGTGHVVLFGTDITYRWQSHGAYFYLWNAIMNWDI